jgi:hypothetical protein
MVWLNLSMGKNGWLFGVLISLGIGPILMIAIFAYVFIQPGWTYWERAIFFAGMLFFFYQVVATIHSFRVASLTAKRIELTPCDLRLLTFSGKYVSFPRSQPWALSKKKFARTYHRILFQKDLEHLVIQDKNHTCYISAYTEDFVGLSEKLEGIQQAN